MLWTRPKVRGASAHAGTHRCSIGSSPTLHPLMNVLEKILDWSSSRPTWQRDALRRLLQQDDLAQADITELTQLCLGTHGTSLEEAPPAPAAVPLATQHIGGMGASGVRIRLTGVRDVHRVNALASGRTLSFGSAGITVIYGDNGSGKSGYTRVLKTVCRARGGTPKIHPNIFSEPSPEAPSAQIDYLLDETPVTHPWADGVAGPDELSGVSVFDTSCASVYVENKTDVAFRPLGLDLFPKLAQACDRVKASVQAAIAAQGGPRGFPDLQGETKVGQLMRSLDSKSAAQTVEMLSSLSEQELARLAELEGLVTQLSADDPRSRAGELALRAKRFRALLEHAQSAETLLADDAAVTLQAAHARALTTGEAARLASGAAFEEEPLPGVGSDAWHTLWKAARKYSEQEAYAGQPFPVVEDGAACVLCHQPLEEIAGNRLRRFEAFVQQEAQEAHNHATAQLEELLRPLRDLSVARAADENVLAELLAYDPSLCEALKAHLDLLQTRVEALRAACTSGEWVGVVGLGESPCVRLIRVVAELEATALQLEKAGEQESAAAIRREHAELLDRTKLAQLKAEALAEIGRQQRVQALTAALKDVETAGITTKNTELTKVAVSMALRDRFAQELKELDLRYLTVSVAPEHGAKGVMFHKIAFEEAKTKGWGARDVLSEGEHRCIALAAFLAEVALQPVASTIILDDPVSSLDHNRREFVARRLVREAKNRPVVVLTHDIVFLLFLQEQAEQQKVGFSGRFLDREKGALGVPVEGLPWYGMKLSKRVSWLRHEVVKLRKTYKEENGETYDRESAFLWGRLREAWECGVEEILLGGAIKRFGRAVSTKPLRVVHDIQESDITAIDDGMTACSKWLPGHDQAAALNNLQLPHPDVLHDGVEALEAWRAVITKRRAVVA